MIFNSLTYLLLLFIVVLIYWLASNTVRLLLVFGSSLVFYGFWRIEFIPLMLFSTYVDFFLAKRIAISENRQKRYLLILSLSINLGLLFVFKYLAFFAENAIGLATSMGLEIDPVVINIILPLGISFYTFQTISYTIDVYRGFIKPEKNIILYSCYVTFFPQLIAGPILRAKEVIPQLAIRPKFDFGFIVDGAKRILIGLFLKVVIADNVAVFVDTGFSLSPDSLSALDVWTLSFLFGFQIYFDFSAYSHIAIGSALLMGVKFPENFNFPYISNSPKDFWKRWHISLSSWIRDYLYLPLSGSKVYDRSTGGLPQAFEKNRNSSALFSSWALMGLWHGANWTFVIWGIYHSLIIYFSRMISNFKLSSVVPIRARVIIGHIITLPLIMLGWIPFRAQSINDTFVMWSIVLSPSKYFSLGLRENMYIVAAIVLLCFYVTYFVSNVVKHRQLNNRVYTLLEIPTLAVLFALTVIYLRPISQFIYFQF